MNTSYIDLNERTDLTIKCTRFPPDVCGEFDGPYSSFIQTGDPENYAFEMMIEPPNRTYCSDGCYFNEECWNDFNFTECRCGDLPSNTICREAPALGCVEYTLEDVGRKHLGVWRCLYDTSNALNAWGILQEFSKLYHIINFQTCSGYNYRTHFRQYQHIPSLLIRNGGLFVCKHIQGRCIFHG